MEKKPVRSHNRLADKWRSICQKYTKLYLNQRVSLSDCQQKLDETAKALRYKDKDVASLKDQLSSLKNSETMAFFNAKERVKALEVELAAARAGNVNLEKRIESFSKLGEEYESLHSNYEDLKGAHQTYKNQFSVNAKELQATINAITEKDKAILKANAERNRFAYYALHLLLESKSISIPQEPKSV